MQTASAYCPAALSFLFRVHPHDDPDRMGSSGVGCTLDRGVTATVQKNSSTEIYFNSEKLTLTPVETIVNELTHTPVRIDLHSDLPLGCGFGISGASCLSVAFALNKYLQLHKPEIELVRLAHRAEVLHKTGLGTVATQSTGGCLVKTKPGIPASVAKRLPLEAKLLYAYILGRIDTSFILNNDDAVTRLDGAGQKSLDTLLQTERITLETLLDISCTFAQESGLLAEPTMIRGITDIQEKHGHATMNMLGNVIISDTKTSVPGFPRPVTIRISDQKVHTL